MSEKNEKKLVRIDDTNFIWRTNFSGDPARDSFGSDARKANIIIRDYDQAMEMIDMGLNVKTTKPKPGEEEDFEPTYYVAFNASFEGNWPPKIYLVSGDAEPRLLDEESVGILDNCYVLNVNAIFNVHTNGKTGRKSLYVRTMYVEQDVEAETYGDPYASRYSRGSEC